MEPRRDEADAGPKYSIALGLVVVGDEEYNSTTPAWSLMTPGANQQTSKR